MYKVTGKILILPGFLALQNEIDPDAHEWTEVEFSETYCAIRQGPKILGTRKNQGYTFSKIEDAENFMWKVASEHGYKYGIRDLQVVLCG